MFYLDKLMSLRTFWNPIHAKDTAQARSDLTLHAQTLSYLIDEMKQGQKRNTEK